MASKLRIGILSAIITAGLVYAVLEWRGVFPRPAASADSASRSEILFDEPEPIPISQPEPSVETPPETTVGDPRDEDEQNNIDIYRRYSRSVVNVASRIYTFNFFRQALPSEGFGSGVVISDDGHIVTNFHVIQNAQADLEVTLADQSRYPATVVGADPNNDLALIRVDAPDVTWIPLPMGTSRGLQVGQKVLAIGNPFGLERTMTTGIISSLGRSIQGQVQNRIIEGVIQTDAAINQGNSGGPLLNKDGELIGINTAILSGATGIGFAVPVDTVRRVTSDLLAYGRVRRPYLGVTGQPLSVLSTQLASQLFGTRTGFLLTETMPGGPADAAGLRTPTQMVAIENTYLRVPVGGDIIVAIDDRSIRNLTDIPAALERHRPGDTVPITIVRDGEQLVVEVELQEEPVG